jgi:hypothetical protein
MYGPAVEMGYRMVPGTHLLDLPGFWFGHWGLDQDFDGLGVDAADVEAAGDALFLTGSAWPAFRLPMRGGHDLWVVYSHLDDDGKFGATEVRVAEAAAEFSVLHPAWPDPARLASVEGHFVGPGLSWAEAVAIASQGPELRSKSGTSAGGNDVGADGTVWDADVRLLLLLPAVGDTDVPDRAATTRIASALDAVGLAHKAAKSILDQIIDSPFWGETTWRALDDSDLRPELHASTLLPTCDGQYSPRRMPLGLGVSPEHEQALRVAIGA